MTLTQNSQNEITGAAVDLGSNTFHLVIANVCLPAITVLDRIREPVRLAAGLDDNSMLTQEAAERALECLGRFSERLRHMPAAHVRAVGTNALRKAKNSQEFLRVAQKTLGHPIQIISGYEEGRLIYAGVHHRLETCSERRLVVDIGGGSTELMIGKGVETHSIESFDVGALTVSLRFFPESKVTRSSMRAAILAVGLEIQTFVSTLQNKGWEVAVGSSGSILAIAEALRQKGWWTNGITYSGLKRLRDFLIDSGRSTPEEFPYINPDRAWVFAGGLAVLMAVFRNLGIDAMHATEGGIREGVLIDLVGQAEHRDIRDTTVRLMAQRYGVDMAQAERVEKKAAWLFRQVQEPWGLHEPEYQLLLGWAAQLHETGLSISHGRYHRHSAYLVEHSDLPGFSLEQQRMLGFLVRAHRRKFPVAELSPFSDEMRSVLTKMAILLRLAVLMRRARIDQPAGTLSIKVSPETITLMTPKGWLDDNPLTAADLLQEQQYLQSAGYSLQF